MVEIDIGIAYLQMARFDAAKRILTAASERAELLGYPYMRITALNQLGLVYLGSGDHDRAIAAFRAALTDLEHLEPSQQRERYKEELTLHLQEAQIAIKDKERA
jgi:tetratricopeptide (TPR) repeat protein